MRARSLQPAFDSEHRLDRDRERIDVVDGNDLSTAYRPDELTGAAVVADDDRRPAEQGFERHEAEDFVAGWVDDHVRCGERVETVATLEEADVHRACVALQDVSRQPGSHVASGDDEPRIAVANLFERSQRHVRALAWRQFGEQQHHRRVAQAMTLPKTAALWRWVELGQIDRVW